MSAETADYIQIFLLGMIVCWFVLAQAIQPDESGFDRNIVVAFFGILAILIVVTAMAFGAAYGVWWVGVRVFGFLTTTDFMELLRNR